MCINYITEGNEYVHKLNKTKASVKKNRTRHRKLSKLRINEILNCSYHKVMKIIQFIYNRKAVWLIIFY